MKSARRCKKSGENIFPHDEMQDYNRSAVEIPTKEGLRRWNVQSFGWKV